jgi:hypothetical protein
MLHAACDSQHWLQASRQPICQNRCGAAHRSDDFDKFISMNIVTANAKAAPNCMDQHLFYFVGSTRSYKAKINVTPIGGWGIAKFT